MTIPDISLRLGLPPGDMHGAARNWLPRCIRTNRDRFRATLDILLEHRRGRLNHEFRVRAEDGHYHWLAIRARPVLGSTAGEIIRCVGTLVDVTEQKNSIDRLLHNALHDNLTGLPKPPGVPRPAAVDPVVGTGTNGVRPTVITVDIDHYKQTVNDAFGIAAGDNILIALTRRLRRLLKPQDTLARLGGDEFGLILMSERDPCQDRRFRRGDEPGDHGADPLRQSRDQPHRLDRPRLLGRPAGKRRLAVGRCRACHVPRQEGRWQTASSPTGPPSAPRARTGCSSKAI